LKSYNLFLKLSVLCRPSPFFKGGLRGFLKNKIMTKNPPDLPLKREESAKIFYLGRSSPFGKGDWGFLGGF